MAKLIKPVAVGPDGSENEEIDKDIKETAGETAHEVSESAEANDDTGVTQGDESPDTQETKPEKKKAKSILKRRKRNTKATELKSEKKKKSKKSIVIGVLVAALLVFFVIWNIHDNNSFEKDFYQVNSSKLTDNVRIVALADLHNKQFGKDNKRLVEEVKKLNPDIIAVVGDMMMEQKPDKYDVALSLCEQLGEVAPLYYSLGNHEIDAMLFSHSNIYKDAKDRGIKILNNEVEKVDINGSTIDVIGLTQNPKEFDTYGRGFFEKAMDADNNFKLLLNHYPEQFLGTLDDYDIDLAIAGHAHGGLVRLPVIGGLYAADQGPFPKLYEGYHEIGNSKLIISRGLSKSGIMPRINNTPEITVIDLSWY